MNGLSNGIYHSVMELCRAIWLGKFIGNSLNLTTKIKRSKKKEKKGMCYQLALFFK